MHATICGQYHTGFSSEFWWLQFFFPQRAMVSLECISTQIQKWYDISVYVWKCQFSWMWNFSTTTNTPFLAMHYFFLSVIFHLGYMSLVLCFIFFLFFLLSLSISLSISTSLTSSTAHVFQPQHLLVIRILAAPRILAPKAEQ